MSNTSTDYVSRRIRAIALPVFSQRRELLSHGFWAIGDQAIVSLASFLATVIVGRNCAPDQLGIYSLAVFTFWLLAGIPNSLVWIPYTARAPRLSQPRRAIFAGSVTQHLLWIIAAMVGALTLLAASPIATWAALPWFPGMCVALVPFIVFVMLREHLRRLLLAHLQLPDLLRLDIPIVVAQLAVLLILAKSELLTATTALLAVGGSAALSLTWLYFWRDRFRFVSRRSGLHFAHNLRFGRWLLIATLAFLSGEYACRWLLQSMNGLTELGKFAAAFSVVLLLNPLILSVSNLSRAVAANQWMQTGTEGIRRSAAVTTLLVSGFFGAMFLCVAMVGDRFVETIFGGAYDGQGRVIAALALGMFVRAVIIPVESALTAMRHGRDLVAAALVQLLLMLGTGVPLIYYLGAEGVGYAVGVGALASLLLQWTLFLRCQEVRIGSIGGCER